MAIDLMYFNASMFMSGLEIIVRENRRDK